MNNSNDDVLSAVIALLQSRNRDLHTVKLEEAKNLTMQVIRCRRGMATCHSVK